MGLSLGCANNNPPKNAIHINTIPEGETYTATRFEFRYGHRTRLVEDPYNKIEWISGELPDAVSVTEGERVIIYNSPKAVLKSPKDSIDVQPASLSYGGYLGVSSEGVHFVVDSDGFLREITDNYNATYIGNLPEDEKYTSTQFEFRFGKETRIVEDPNNKMEWILGAMPNSISVTNGDRLIVYNSPGAVIKSRTNSIEVDPDFLSYEEIFSKVRSEATHFLVTSDGNIIEIKR